MMIGKYNVDDSTAPRSWFCACWLTVLKALFSLHANQLKTEYTISSLMTVVWIKVNVLCINMHMGYELSFDRVQHSHVNKMKSAWTINSTGVINIFSIIFRVGGHYKYSGAYYYFTIMFQDTIQNNTSWLPKPQNKFWWKKMMGAQIPLILFTIKTPETFIMHYHALQI